jgi:hypothetical protein
MDNPAGGSMKSGVAFEPGSTSTFTSLFSFTVNSSVPKSFVVGLFFNNGGGEWAHAQITEAGQPGLVPEQSSVTLTRSFSRLAGRQVAPYLLYRALHLQEERLKAIWT